MKRLIVLALIILLPGCAMLQPRPAEEVVAERALERWAAIAERDFATAYEYLSPGAKQLQSEGAYAEQMRRSMVRWNGAEVTDVSCDETRCEVRVEIAVTVIGALQGARRVNTTAPANETWLKSGRKWYFVPQR